MTSYDTKPNKLGDTAVISFSGGQDSTTCLHWALRHFRQVQAVAFDYGQRHKRELQSARDIAKAAKVSLSILPIAALGALGGNSLTDVAVPVSQSLTERGLPNSFVPGRNVLFLSLVAAYAYQRDIHDIVAGVCQTDYSGYPDCRRSTMDSLEKTLSLAMDHTFRIHTPLMLLTKAQSVELAQELPGCLQALALSHTCYKGQRPPCGTCPACELRAKGFAEVGIEDPLNPKV